MDPEVILRQAQSNIRATENEKITDDAIHGTIAIIDFADAVVSPFVDSKPVQAEKQKTREEFRIENERREARYASRLHFLYHAHKSKSRLRAA